MSVLKRSWRIRACRSTTAPDELPACARDAARHGLRRYVYERKWKSAWTPGAGSARLTIPGTISATTSVTIRTRRAAWRSLKSSGSLKALLHARAPYAVYGHYARLYKWGSTNVYTEDEAGNPVYYYDCIDEMMDIWLKTAVSRFSKSASCRRISPIPSGGRPRARVYDGQLPPRRLGHAAEGL